MFYVLCFDTIYIYLKKIKLRFVQDIITKKIFIYTYFTDLWNKLHFYFKKLYNVYKKIHFYFLYKAQPKYKNLFKYHSLNLD